jgi:hypothetical protein
MAKTSLYKIYEQVQRILGKGEPQELIELVKQSYATAVKISFYEGKQDGVTEISGSAIYSFGKDTPLTPVLDDTTGEYYITIPSSYVDLPNDSGVHSVSYLRSQNKPMVKLANGGVGLFAGLKSYALGGNGVFYVEGTRMYFPKMSSSVTSVSGSVGNILLKLAVALDEVDVDDELNIPPNIVETIIKLVVEKYAPKPDEKPDDL